MALQTEGAISINDIRTELGETSGSLDFLSSLAGFSSPHSIGEFYGYSLPSNSSVAIIVGVVGFESPSDACLVNLSEGSQTLYAEEFSEGMTLYIDSGRTQVFGDGADLYWFLNYDGVSYSAFIDGQGSASQITTCK